MKGKGYITFMVAAALSMALQSLPWRRNRAVGNQAVRSWEP